MKWMTRLLLATTLLFSAMCFATEPTTININTATAEQLAQLQGIGKTKAEAIVKYRESNGAFSSADELVLVKGIGENILEKNRSLIITNAD
ncbi:MAG: helix-hairpin-helix domain-containing protein [Pseudomonadota bacterium]